MRDVYQRELEYNNQQPSINATGDGPTGDSRPVTAQLLDVLEDRAGDLAVRRLEHGELYRQVAE